MKATLQTSYTSSHVLVDATIDDGHSLGQRYQLRVDEEGNATFFVWNWPSAAWCELGSLDIDRQIGAALADDMADAACGAPPTAPRRSTAQELFEAAKYEARTAADYRKKAQCARTLQSTARAQSAAKMYARNAMVLLEDALELR